MISNFLTDKIIQLLPYAPNKGQHQCIERLAMFCTSPTPHHLFLLKGYAGTGKTSLVGAFVNAMMQMGQKCVLMAPTGRAAKVFHNYSGQKSFSIHKKIYRQKSASEFQFSLSDNLHKNTFFVVDEASMISNKPNESLNFGSGYLLNDLIQYVYSGENCSLILLGDTAQLPPVMQPLSPALDKHCLESFGLDVEEFELTEVARQETESGILSNATSLRHLLSEQRALYSPQVDDTFPDVATVVGSDLIDSIYNAYRESGMEECIIITRSNKRAILYNRGIRNQVLQQEDELSNGDLLMITKNNYFWSKAYADLDFIANGDTVEIVRTHKHYELYGCRFADVTLRFLDYDLEVEARILIDSLYTSSSSEVDALNKKLFVEVAEDYADVSNKRDKMKQMMDNPFLNALQIKFAYAITCHKAQGGQWKQVFVDAGQVSDEQKTAEYIRWLYTAFTRSQEKLYIINKC
jgi:exodeoxyribonuclease V